MWEGLSLLRQAVEALISLAFNSHAATAFIACLVLVLTLESIRSKRGPEVNFFRILALGAVGLLVASYVYGDILAAPAQDAWSDFSATKDRLLPFVTTEQWFIVAGIALVIFLFGLRRLFSLNGDGAAAKPSPSNGGPYPRANTPVNLRAGSRRGPRTVITPTGTPDLMELRLVTRNQKKRPSTRRPKRNPSARSVQR